MPIYSDDETLATPGALPASRGISTRSPAELTQLARDEASSLGVDPDLAARMVHQESRGRADALSPKGAFGPAQLMPGTAADLERRYGGNARDPGDNVRLGVRYLKEQLDTFGNDPVLASAAYNAGPGAVQKYGGVPPYKETRDYVQKVARNGIPVSQRAAQIIDRQAKPAPKQESWNGYDDWELVEPTRLSGPSPTSSEPVAERGFLQGTWDFAKDTALSTLHLEDDRSQSTGGDLGRALGGQGVGVAIPQTALGVNRWAADTPSTAIASALVPQVMLDWRDSVNNRFSAWLNKRSADLQAQKTPTMQESAKKQYFDSSWKDVSEHGLTGVPDEVIQRAKDGRLFGSGWSDWRKMSDSALQSLPVSLVSMIPATRAAGTAYKGAYGAALDSMPATMATDAAEKAAREIAVKAAERTAGYMGGAMEGITGAGSQYEQTYQQVMDLPQAKLEASASYQQALKLQPTDLAPDERAMRARRTMAHAASSTAAIVAGISDALLGGLGDRYLGSAAAGKDGRMRSVLRGLKQETPTEFAQSGLEQFSTNLGVQRFADPTQSLTDQVGEQAVGGALSGGLMGGAMGGASYHKQGTPAEDQSRGAESSPVATGAVPASDFLEQPDNLGRTEPSGASRVSPQAAAVPPVDAAAAALEADPTAVAPSRALDLTPGAPTTFSTETGVHLEGYYALVNPDNVIASHDIGLRPNPAYPKEYQPRDRQRASSELQVSSIAQRLNPARLGASPDVANGAPIIGEDGLLESGLARTTAVKRVFESDGFKAQEYRQWLSDNAEAFGFTKEDVAKDPGAMLFRVRTTPVNRAEFARQANASTVAAMSPTEQAASDVARIGHLDDLHLTEDGDLTGTDNRGFVNRFVGGLSPGEQAGMLDAGGRLSQAGVTRIRNAVMARAYGNSPTLMRMVESADANLRNLTHALTRVAPQVAKAREAIDAGALHDADLTADLLAAVEELAKIKEDGRSVDDALAQMELGGQSLSDETRDLIRFLDQNIRAPRRVAAFISDYFDALAAFGNPQQQSLLDAGPIPDMRSLIAQVKERTHASETNPATTGAAAQPGATPEPQPGSTPGGTPGPAEAETSEWVAFPPDSGTLGIPRAEMPQVKSVDRGALVQFLKGRGITHEKVQVDPHTLRPTQAEFSMKKTAKWSEVREGTDRSILISSDGYVLDGHHQWVAALANGEQEDAIRFDAPIRELLAAVFEFPSVQRSEGGTNVIDLAAVREQREAMAEQDFQAALADLGTWVRENLTGTFRMVPEDTPELLATLGRLFDAAIRKGYLRFSKAVTHVMAALRRDKTTAPLANAVKPQMLQRAFDEALKRYTANVDHDGAQEDLFAEPKAGVSGDLFASERASSSVPKVTQQAQNSVPTPATGKDSLPVGASPPNFIDWIKQQGDTWPVRGERLEKLRDQYAAAYPQQITRKNGRPIGSDVVNRIDLTAEPQDKVDALVRLAKENEPLVKAFIAKVDAKFGTESKSSFKEPEKILSKSVRPSILAAKPWYGVEHIRDSFRFKTVLQRYSDLPAIVATLRAELGAEIVEQDTRKVLAPKEWGWRIVAFDLRMPNGQLVEYYLPIAEQEAYKKAEGHQLFEDWRNKDVSALTDAELADYQRALLRSNAGYQSAWEASIARTGQDEAAVRAFLTQLSASEPSTRENSSLSSSAEKTLRGTQTSSTKEPKTPASESSTITERPSSERDTTGFIASTSGAIIHHTDKGAGDENAADGTPGGQGPGAGPTSATEPGRRPAGVRSGARGPDRQPGRAGGDGRPATAQPRPAAADGSGAGDERQPAGGDGTRPARKPRVSEPERAAVIPPKSGGNYRFTDEDLSYAGGWLTKARQNISAVELVQQLEREGRRATPAEQAVLAKYVGWGASELAQNLFSDKLDAKLEAIEQWDSAMSSMQDRGVGILYRGQPGHWLAAKLVATKDGSPFAHHTYKYSEITRAQLEAAKPDMGIKKWAELRDQLKALLSAEEWASASRSTQNAHYTSKEIVRSMWEVMKGFGFAGGSVLEPGAGIGVFPGLMPADIAPVTAYTGIEFDRITGTILKQLFPDEQVRVESYVASQLPSNFYDVAIGNPPFASTPILEDPAYKKYGFPLHDYFFAKTIDKVRPGGVVAFVSSRYTMDKRGDKMRDYLAERADLIGAIRLPQTAFKKNAGTEVITDVLFLQKRAPGQAAAGQAWAGIKDVVIGGHTFGVNQYFVEHPEMVLGTHSSQGSMRSKNEYTVLPNEASSIDAQFAAAAASLPKGIYSAARGSSGEAANVAYIDFSPTAQKEGNYYLDAKDRLMVREEGVGRVVPQIKYKKDGPGLRAKDAALVRAFIPLRDALKQAQFDQLNDTAEWEGSLAALNKAYKAFVKAHGNVLQFTQTTRNVQNIDEDTGEVELDPETGEPITAARIYRTFPFLDAIRDDPDWTLVAALEKINEDSGKITPSAFLSERQLNKPAPPQIRSVSDALLSVLNDYGKVDMPLIAERIGESQTAVIEALGTAIYEDPAAGWVTADAYLSGNVRAKLEQARAAAATDQRYERNVQALLANQPADVAPGDIAASLGMNWIAPQHYVRFMAEKIGVTVTVGYEPRTSSWHVDAPTASKEKNKDLRKFVYAFPPKEQNAATVDWGTQTAPANVILEHALTGAPIALTKMVPGEDGKWVPVADKDGTEAANQKMAQMREAFRAWVWTDVDRASELATIYNQKFNTHVARKFDGRHLTLPGASQSIKVHDHVKRGAWRIIQDGDTYLAHAVGAGKTWADVIALMEMKRLGMVNKPMVVVPNHMLAQWAAEWLQLYPAARLAVADEKNFTGDNRRRFVSRVALSDLDGVIITQSAFKLLDLDPAFKQKLINRELEFYRAALKEAGGDPDKLTFDKYGKRVRGKGEARVEPNIKRIEAAIESLEQKLAAAMSSAGKDQNVRLDQMGIDHLTVDEAQDYRKLQFITQRAGKGIDAQGSQRAFDLWMKTRWLAEKKPGRSLVMLSGTPVTNTLAELFSVQRYMNPAALDEKGLSTFDDWAAMFGEMTSELEADPGGKYTRVSRFAKFENVPELTQMFRDFADVLTADHLAALMGDKRPKVLGGTRNIVVTPDIPEHADYKLELSQRLAISRAWKPSFDQPNNPDPVIAIIGDGRLAASDMRFMRNLAGNPDSKLNKLIDQVIQDWQTGKDIEYLDKDTGQPEKLRGSTQMVFANIGFGAGVAKRRGFDARAWFEKRLRDAGIPPGQVAFMVDYKRSDDKIRLFGKMNRGEVRILVGSDANMGTGVNAQQRLAVMQHLDVPWFPAALTQREGRIIRQGNKNPTVRINAFATGGSYDSVMWQQVARKQRFIDQALSGDVGLRSLEDISESSQMQMAQAMTAANPKAIELAGAQAEVERLMRLARAHDDSQWAMRRDNDEALRKIGYAERTLPNAQAQAAKVKDLSGDKFTATIGKQAYDKRKDWGTALLARFNELADQFETQSTALGEISGFPIAYHANTKYDSKGTLVDFAAYLGLQVGDRMEWYTYDRKADPVGLTMSIGNTLEKIRREPATLQETIAGARDQIAALRQRIGAPFEFAQMLADKRAEVDRLEAEMVSTGQPTKVTPDVLMLDRRSRQALAAADRQPLEPVMSRGAGGPGVDIAEVRALAQAVRAGLGNAAQIEVAATPDELPANLLAHVSKNNAMADVHAIFDPQTQTIHLVAGNLGSMEEAEAALFHDLFGHYGLRGIIGDAYTRTMRQISANNANVRREASAIRARYGYGELLAIEEALAERAGAGETVRMLDRVAAALIAGLRRIGLTRMADFVERMTDAEVRVLLGRAREFVRGVNRNANNLGPEMAMSRGDQTATPAFAKWFGKSVVTDTGKPMNGGGKPLVLYHGTTGDRTVFKPYWKQLEEEATPVERARGSVAKLIAVAKTEPELHFFAEDRAVAESYGSDVVQAFLRIERPVFADSREAAIERMLESDADGARFPDTTSGGRAGGYAWVVRDSRQIKSTSNNGDFDPANPSIVMARAGQAPANASPTQRADAFLAQQSRRFAPLETVLAAPFKLTRLDRVLAGSSDRLLQALGHLVPEAVKQGVVADYKNPQAVIDRRQAMRGAQSRLLRETGDLLNRLSTLTRGEARVAYEWMNSQDPQSAEWFRQQLPEESLRVLAEIEKLIDRLSKEAVALGQLNPESFARNRFAYLRRSYVKHTAELDPQEVKARQRSIAIFGEQYKGRGMFEAVPMAKIENIAPAWWKRKLQTGKADTALKGEKFIRLELRVVPRDQMHAKISKKHGLTTVIKKGSAMADTATGTLPGIIPQSQKTRLMEVKYFPAGETLPTQYLSWDQAGTWEVRDVKGKDAVMWRDFSKAEREQMGEIDEVRFAVAKTLHGMIHDVEAGKFLQWIAENHAKKTKADLPAGALEEVAAESNFRVLNPDAWVQVPDKEIPKSGGVKLYGTLGGRFVPVPVWNDIRQSTGRQRPIGGPLWGAILRAWKVSKTALSPSVHMNNVAANVVMADWADVGVIDLAEALSVIVKADKDPAMREILDRFEDAGGKGGTFAVSELQREQLEPLLEALRQEYRTAGQATGMVGIQAALGLLLKRQWKAAYEAGSTSLPARGARKAANAMIDIYQSEDVVFRLAKWIKEKRAGASDERAAKAARDSFLNYEINAPWIQAMRQSAFPFIAFTYRAAPMLLHIATHKPWKILKLGLVYGALNALGYALSGGDEDKERKLLPEEKAGRLWGVGPPKLVRMGWNDAHDQPVFLDVRRWIPVGDIVDLGQTHGAVPIVPFLVPSGPLALLGELVANKSQFTGQEIVKRTDTAGEVSAKVFNHVYKSFAPNLPMLPGTYSFDSLVNAGGGKTDPFGRELSLPQAAASAVGVKLASYPPDVMLRQLSGKRVGEMREIEDNVAALTRDMIRKGISVDTYNKEVAAQRKKAERINKKYFEMVR